MKKIPIILMMSLVFSLVGNVFVERAEAEKKGVLDILPM
jgi:hypothetical protein